MLRGEIEAQLARQSFPGQVMVFGGIDDDAVEVEDRRRDRVTALPGLRSPADPQRGPDDWLVAAPWPAHPCSSPLTDLIYAGPPSRRTPGTHASR